MEVVSTIQKATWQPAKRNKMRAEFQFDFFNTSPVNSQFYNFKKVDVVFVDEPTEIVVVTVKVYYFN